MAVNPPTIYHVRARIADAIAEHKSITPPAKLVNLTDLAGYWPITVSDEVPCVMPVGANKFDRVVAGEHFRKRLLSACAALESFDFKRHGVVLAGGSVSALALFKPADAVYGDFDLFLVGQKSDAERLRTIKTIGNHIDAWLGEPVKAEPIQGGNKRGLVVYRTSNCVTFYYKLSGAARPTVIQIVLRAFRTPAEVIHDFDLCSSAFLWDGEHVMTTAFGRLAAEHRVNVLDLRGRRATYESRIARYFDRGFGIVMPHVDMCALAEAGGVMPFLELPGFSRVDRHMALASCIKTVAQPVNADAEEYAEEYYNGNAVPYGDHEAILRNNIELCFASTGNMPLCVWAPWSDSVPLDEMQAVVDADSAIKYLRDQTKYSGFNIEAVVRTLGPDAANELFSAHLRAPVVYDKIVNKYASMIAQTCKDRRRIEMFFQPPDQQSSTLTISVDDWYGSARFGSLFTRTK